MAQSLPPMQKDPLSEIASLRAAYEKFVSEGLPPSDEIRKRFLDLETSAKLPQIPIDVIEGAILEQKKRIGAAVTAAGGKVTSTSAAPGPYDKPAPSYADARTQNATDAERLKQLHAADDAARAHGLPTEVTGAVIDDAAALPSEGHDTFNAATAGAVAGRVAVKVGFLAGVAWVVRKLWKQARR